MSSRLYFALGGIFAFLGVFNLFSHHMFAGLGFSVAGFFHILAGWQAVRRRKTVCDDEADPGEA